MKGKRIASAMLSLVFLTPALFSLGGCAADKEITLRVYNWEEYIDEGGKGSYEYDYEINEDGSAPHILDDFEEWYEETYGKSVRVVYSTFGTNEDLYNQLKLGDKYDLVCPSEYMIMKLAAEDMLEPLDTESLEIYNENVSDKIARVFESTPAVGDEPLKKYAAGYMWGVTGLVYNPDLVEEKDLAQGWGVMLDQKYKNKVTTKDNVRDSYFVGLGIHYRDRLLELKTQNENGEISDEAYTAEVTDLMNDPEPETVKAVQKILIDMKKNIFGFETDTGKNDMVKGTISMNFAWSGDAVYAMDQAEGDEKTPESERLYLNYYIPEEGANLFFDGWVMPKDENRDEDTKHAAHAFIDFMSMPENAVRNSYYIGYTSVIAGEEMFDYVLDTYSAEDEENAVPYDVSYFFKKGENDENEYVIYADEDQLCRQLYAQFPPSDTVKRCVVMKYYGEEEEAINELWTQIKGETLDAWAIIVICVCVIVIILTVVFTKFGSKIEFRIKPKKGYRLIEQKEIRP